MKIKLITASLLISATCLAQVRREFNINRWQFSHDNTKWEQVTVPHDWAISGPFDKKWDLQYVAITQNGETEKTGKSGRSGALPWIGEGFYKTTFNVPSEYCRAMLKFDGAMSEPTVYINGHKAIPWLNIIIVISKLVDSAGIIFFAPVFKFLKNRRAAICSLEVNVGRLLVSFIILPPKPVIQGM